MIKHYLKNAFISLRRQGMFSLINIIGMAVGMTACFLMFLCVRSEANQGSLAAEANRILIATGMVASLVLLFAICFWTMRPSLPHHGK